MIASIMVIVGTTLSPILQQQVNAALQSETNILIKKISVLDLTHADSQM